MLSCTFALIYLKGERTKYHHVKKIDDSEKYKENIYRPLGLQKKIYSEFQEPNLFMTANISKNEIWRWEGRGRVPRQ